MCFKVTGPNNCLHLNFFQKMAKTLFISFIAAHFASNQGANYGHALSKKNLKKI